MIAELEQDNTDIGFDIFLEAIENKLGEKVKIFKILFKHPSYNQNTRDSINKVFDLFDEDRCNRITLNNLKKAANELGEDLSHE